MCRGGEKVEQRGTSSAIAASSAHRASATVDRTKLATDRLGVRGREGSSVERSKKRRRGTNEEPNLPSAPAPAQTEERCSVGDSERDKCHTIVITTVSQFGIWC